MLVLEGKGAADDADAFRSAGIGDFKVFNFERAAKRPDGSPVKVAFSLAFATDTKAQDIGYFTCQQHHPENFWNPAFQKHPNGATGIAGVIMVSENPESHRHFLSAFSGVGDVKSGANGIAVETPRGAIQVLNPDAYRMHIGTEPPDLSRGARLAAIRFAVRGQDAFEGHAWQGRRCLFRASRQRRRGPGCGYRRNPDIRGLNGVDPDTLDRHGPRHQKENL